MQAAVIPVSQKPKEVIAVIGAGLAGCISAIYLAKAGYDVLLIEEKDGIMSVTSKIPVHLHSGGLYIKGKVTELDMEDAYHCLHDSINFMKAMSFAVVPRLTAFAVMSVNDEQNILPNGKTQLLDEATDIYHEELRRKLDTQKANYTSDAFELERKRIDQAEIPTDKIEEFKQKALTLQFEKWEIMQKGFAALQKKYEEMIHLSGDNKVFGDPRTFFSSCSQGKFSALKEIALSSEKQENDFSLDNKEGWTLQLARVTDPKTIIGVVMSSELGLNMIRAQAGLQMELENLKGNGVSLVLGKKVESVSRIDERFALKIRGSQHPIIVSQIVNAAGHQGKDFDLQMGYQLGWSVDVKGVGIIELLDKEFDCTPEVYFTQAKGMCHFGRLNQGIAGVNFTTPYVEATYVKDGKQVIPKDQPVTLSPILNQFLLKPITDPSFVPRTNECIAGCSRFMPSLKKSAKAIAYFPGSLAIVGTNLNSRASVEVYISESGYHALNIIKGGGAVSAAMTLVQKVENYSRSKYNSTNNHFPNGSHSPIPQEFVLKYDPKVLEERAKSTATQLQLAEKAGSSYRP